MAKSDTVAVPESDAVASWVATFDKHPELRRTVIEMLSHDENPAAAIAMGLLTATTVDDIFGKATVAKWTPGEAYDVVDASLQRSDYFGPNTDSVLPVYAVVTAMRLEDHSDVLLTIGSTNVVAQLIAAKTNGLLPLRLRLTETKTTANFYVQRLETVDVEEDF